MQTQFLQEFICLALEKSFSRAALKLHMSRTSLHRHIAMLEKEVGAPLIVRTTPIRLTSIGRIVLEKASAIEAELEEMYSLVDKGKSNEIANEVRVLVPPFTTTMNLVTKTLYVAKQRYPNISLIFINSLKDENVTQSILSNKLDIGFIYYYYKNKKGKVLDGSDDLDFSSDLSQTILCDLHRKLRFCINRDHPLFDVESSSLREIVSHGLVVPADKTYQDGNNTLFDFFEREQIEFKKYYAETDGLLEMWLGHTGKGCFLVSEDMNSNPVLPDEFLEGVRILIPSDDVYHIGLSAFSSKDNQNPAVDAVLNVLAECLNSTRK